MSCDVLTMVDMGMYMMLQVAAYYFLI